MLVALKTSSKAGSHLLYTYQPTAKKDISYLNTHILLRRKRKRKGKQILCQCQSVLCVFYARLLVLPDPGRCCCSNDVLFEKANLKVYACPSERQG